MKKIVVAVAAVIVMMVGTPAGVAAQARTYEDCLNQPVPARAPAGFLHQLCEETFVQGPARVQARERALSSDTAMRRMGHALGVAALHRCGGGDVVIEIIHTECPLKVPREALTHVDGRTYRRDPPGEECAARTEERWTDWPPPECNGKPY